MAEPVDPMFGGLAVGQWFDIFADTHAPTGFGSWMRLEWPEPGGYAEQPAVVPLALSLVAEAYDKESERARGRTEQRH